MNKEFEIHLVIGIGAVVVLYYLYEKYAAVTPMTSAESLGLSNTSILGGLVNTLSPPGSNLGTIDLYNNSPVD